MLAPVGHLLLHDLMRPGAAARRDALRRNAPLYVSYAASGLALVAITALTPAPEGENVWLTFRDRISVHAGALAFNTIGLDVPFGYSAEQSVEARRAALLDGDDQPWEEIVQASLDDRAVPRAITAALLLAATALCARRLPRRRALFLGFPLLFTLMYQTHYYYLSLGLLALVFHDDRAVLLALATGFGAIALLAPPPLFADDVLRMGFVSIATGATLFAIGALGAREGPEPASGSGT